MVNEQNTANDYALAKYLDERVAEIFALVADYHHNLPDLKALNRSYVLIVNELKRLYQRNPELSSIQENICWRTFETIDAIDPHDLYQYSDDYTNHGLAHISKVNSLCIIAGKDTPAIKPDLQKILDEASATVQAFLTDLNSKNPEVRDWYISEYTLTYKLDGVILVNNVLKLKKARDGSALDTIMQQALDHPNELFTPKIKTAKRYISIISDANFTPTLRSLFFPSIIQSKGILFRSSISAEMAKGEHIDTTALDRQLKELGAETKQIQLLA